MGGEIAVYTDEHDLDLTAVLNDNWAESPGWRDHLVKLELVKTPEWRFWLGKDGHLLEQEAFAEHIEDGVTEIASPPAGDLLDLAQTLSITRNVKFKSSKRLSDGRVQYLYDEDDETTAGTDGNVTVPEEFELVVRPFIGAPSFKVRAMLRRRFERGHLRLGYKLVRPHDVERAVFKEIADEVRTRLEGETEGSQFSQVSIIAGRSS